MGALPIPSPQPAYPHAPYIEELHDFFTVRNVPFGSPSDLAILVERLDDPGLFHEDLRVLVRYILLREKGAISRSDLLAILAVGVGGPLIYRSAQQLRQPLSRLLDFVDGVLRRPNGQPVPVSRGELIPFPITTPAPSAVAASVPEPRSRARVWLTSMPRSAVRSLRPTAAPSPSFRNAVLVAVVALMLVVLLALVLRPSTTHAAAVNVPGGFYVAKPSPFGAAFEPALRPFLRYEQGLTARFATRADSASLAQTGDADSLTSAAMESSPAGSNDDLTTQPTPSTSAAVQPSPLSLELAPEFSPASSVNSTPAGVVEPAVSAPALTPEAATPSPSPAPASETPASH